MIRVFIGSPGGLTEERQIAHDVVQRVNKSHSERWGILFKLMGWEDAVPGFVRPQSKINEDLDRCDYFIGVLWNYWGSQPSLDTGYTSGFEEEYYRAAQRIEAGLMKDMAIYFKRVEVPTGMEPGDAIRKVLDFKRKFIDEKKVFFKDFSDGPAFKDLVREKLEEIGWNETAVITGELISGEASSDTGSNRDTLKGGGSRLIDDSGRQFLETLSQKPRDWELTASHEIARLRLLGSALGRSGNDEYFVGNHDANLLFREHRNTSLSEQELQALIDCGIAGLRHQNVPLWRWMVKYDDDPWSRVKVLALAGNENQKRHAIEVLELGAQPIPTIDGLLDKPEVFSDWFGRTASDQTFNAAISFLSRNALVDDIGLLEAASLEASAARKPKIEEAIAAILARLDLDAALVRLVKSEADKVDPELIDLLFSDPQSIATKTAVLCMSAKSEAVRLRAVEMLYVRKEISLDDAQILLTDSNHEIRLLAAESLKRLGFELEDEQIKTALQKISSPIGVGLLRRNETDSTYYNRYRKNRLLELDLASLRNLSETAVIDDEELAAIYVKYGTKVVNEIRTGLKDRFKSHFEDKIQVGVAAGFIDEDMSARMRKLEEFVRDRMVNAALNALCKISSPTDLAVVRAVIDGGHIEATAEILGFLGKHGDWSDVERIKALGEDTATSVSFLGIAEPKLVFERAKAVISIGKHRTVDVLALNAASEIRLEIAKQLPKRVIRELRDEVLIAQLQDPNDEFRIVFALRCVECLPKTRVIRLLDRYVDSSEHRYYNSVHWLDLGASFPSALAKSIAGRALA